MLIFLFDIFPGQFFGCEAMEAESYAPVCAVASSGESERALECAADGWILRGRMAVCFATDLQSRVGFTAAKLFKTHTALAGTRSHRWADVVPSQLLQWRHKRAPWVLKSPGHLWSLGELLDEYPDARFVQTHRDPLRMLASLTSLMTHLRKMASDEVDAAQIAREWAEWNALGLNESAAFRASGRIAEGRVVDVDFHDFMRSPVTELGRIYDSLGLALPDAVAARMADYLAVHNDQQHGAHRYTFDDTGLDRATERERVVPYQQYFGTPVEV